MSFPARLPTRADPAPKARVPEAPKEPTRVLVIDDDLELQDFIKAALHRAPYELHFAGDGREGVRQAQRVRPGLILIDLNMPLQNGVEVFRQVRAQEAFKDIPCVMMTGLRDTAGVLQSAILALGAVEFLQKPFSPGDLMETLEHTLSRPSRGASPEIRRGPVRLDPVFRRVWIRDRFLGHLPPRRFFVLAALAQSQGPVDRETILKEVWGSSMDDPHSLDKTIQRLREDLGQDSHLVMTTPGGYQFGS